LIVGDQQHFAREHAFLIVEGLEFFFFIRATNYNHWFAVRAFGDKTIIERVQRLAGFEHDVIRHVHDIADAGDADGFEPLSNVKIIAATNRPDILDEALLRPGRFDRIIEVPVPGYLGRVEIFKIHSRGMALKDPIDFEALASRCEGATGADIRAICTEAGMWAIREERETVSAVDFERAVEKVIGEDEPGKESVTMFA